MTDLIGRDDAASFVLEALPAFRLYYEGFGPYPGEERLLHIVMGELASFYMERGLAEQPELAGRYWSVVEDLAARGDEYVKDAVRVSLIEWFAWGNAREQAALRDAGRMQGPATTAMVAAFDAHKEWMERCTHEGTSEPDNALPWLTRCSACGRMWPTD